jgi:hypothetical protein
MTVDAEHLNDPYVSETGNMIGWLGVSCMTAAILSGILKGVWEITNPILEDPATFAFANPTQLWGYGLLEVVKAVGFLGGLFGFYLYATKRGMIMNVLMGLAGLGAIFFAVVWMVMASSSRFTLVYVMGGVWFQVVAPIALGIAAIFARRIPWWQSAVPIVVGILNAQLFALLGPGPAMLVQGVIWLGFGYLVHSFRPIY